MNRDVEAWHGDSVIFVTEPHNAPPKHKCLVAEITPVAMRVARCERREFADSIARAWRDRIYTITGEIRIWSYRDPAFSV